MITLEWKLGSRAVRCLSRSYCQPLADWKSGSGSAPFHHCVVFPLFSTLPFSVGSRNQKYNFTKATQWLLTILEYSSVFGPCQRDFSKMKLINAWLMGNLCKGNFLGMKIDDQKYFKTWDRPRRTSGSLE